ncbi:MAG: hypothetical protein CVT94_07320 [Bacteroidetes bacterium HGW-Bacteroidetes-11]|nr:MAG: hypothetical protein CVT94_07320 [Bacteroidetes bacterium HGW-Bacteroidetes-11]
MPITAVWAALAPITKSARPLLCWGLGLNSFEKAIKIYIMKTNIFFTLTCFLISLVSYGQGISPLEINNSRKIDDCKYQVKYNLRLVNNLAKPDNKKSDVLILEIGQNTAKSYSYGLYKYDSIATVEIAKGAEAIPSFTGVTLPYIIYRDNQKFLTVNHRILLVESTVYQYNEEPINFNWSITKESKDIFGYSCQKATCTFRGRKWEAWFTREIPISEGPWKFSGLPGLILKISDQDKHFDMEVISFTVSNKPILKWEWEFENTSRKEVLSFEKYIHENPYNFSKSKGVQFFLYKKSEAEARKFSFPYNPIELE